MKFSYEWIKELSGSSLDAPAAAQILSSKAFEVESVTDGVMEIKILPNRPDCLSHLGVARELCALTSQQFIAPAYEYKATEHPAVRITIEDTQACPRYSGLVVRGIQVGPSPEWMVQRLAASGQKSINNVVDVTNYVMLELGQPMHAFDLAKVSSITVRHATPGEQFTAIDEARTQYALDPSMLVIADASGPVAIAGVKGGAGSGITPQTTDIFLEAANFDSVSVRATSHKLGLRTDASIRFSYGVDANLTAAALMRAAELLAKVASGTPDRDIIDVYPQPRVAQVVYLDPEYVRSLLGVQVGDAQIRSILASLGFDVADREGMMHVTVPTRRLDVSTPEDLIEEVGRVYGYDAIISRPPVLPVYSDRHWVLEDAEGVVWDEYGFIRERTGVAHLLAGAGYTEAYNYSFISDELKSLLYTGDTQLHELAQPQSAEYRWLRTSLVPRLLLNARDNLRFWDQVHLFETGHVFDHVGDSRESARLGLVLAHRAGDDQLFYELKGAVDLLLEHMGVADYYYDDADANIWDAGVVNATITGHRALIRLEGDGHIIGCIGAVSKRVTDALKLKGSAAVAELCLRSLIRHAQREREFEPLPKYPSVTRDIAILVDQGVKVDDIIQVVHEADTQGLVQDVDIFDIFQPTGKEKIATQGDTPDYGKSVAFHVLLRANDRTLRDDEAAAVEAMVKKALEEKLGARIR